MTFKKHSTNRFLYSSSLAAKITSKLFVVSANWRKKNVNRPVRAENSVRYTECPLITCLFFRKFL